MTRFLNKSSKALLTFLFNFYFVFAIAQTPEVIEISRQELPTTIRSQTTDEEGNTYYAGVFRGALVINDDTLAYGKGGNDYFIVRQSMSGNIEWVIPIGGEQEENGTIFVQYHQGSIYANFTFTNPVKINETSIEPLQQGNNANCVLKINSSGNVIWNRIGNIINSKIYPLNGNLIAVGTILTIDNDASYDSKIVFKANGFNNTFLQSINSTGDLVAIFPLFNKYSASSQLSTLLRVNTKENQLYFLFIKSNSGTQTGSNTLSFNGHEIEVASTSSTILVKSDTSLNVLGYKILNPNGPGFYSGSHDEKRIQFSSDSLKLHLLLNFGTYNNDGYNETFSGKFGIAILDTNLMTTGIKVFYGQTSIEGQNRISCEYFKEHAGNFFVFGTLVGSKFSSSPISIPENNKQIQLAINKIIPFDINGPSKSFILRANTNFEYINHSWIGDNTVQEISIFPMQAFDIKGEYIRFFQMAESTFNPWIVSLNGNILRGSAKPVADRSDFPVNVAYFSNKSRILLGQTHGLNAFDSNDSGITKSSSRSDFFFAIMDSNNQLKKYVRMFGTFSRNAIVKTIARNDSVYALLQITGPNNPLNYNFISIGPYQTAINTNRAILLLAIDSSGNLSVRNFTQTNIGEILDFDFFNNGDFAILSNLASISYNHNGQLFPNNYGFYAARMNSQGTILQVIKVFQPNNQAIPRGILVENDGDNFTINMQNSLSSGSGNYVISTIRNGNEYTHQTINIQFPPSNQSRGSHFYYKTSFTQNRYLSFLGPFSIFSGSAITGIRKKTYILYGISSSLMDNLKYNDTIISSVPHLNQTLILGVDENGKIENKFTISSLPNQVPGAFTGNFIKRIGDFIYVIGAQNNDLAIGAMNIKHKGGSDGLILKLDTSLNLVQFYKVASIYSDFCTDIAFLPDSSFMIAYRSQGTPVPSVGLGEVAQLQSAGTILPSDFLESGYVWLMPPSLAPRDFVFTIKNGTWHDPMIWNTGTVPVAADRVFVRHKVQITQPAECHQIFVDPASDLKMDNGTTLSISGKATTNL